MNVVRYLASAIFCLALASLAIANETISELSKTSDQVQNADETKAKVLYDQAIKYMSDTKNAKANQPKIIDLLKESATLNYAPAQVDLGKVYYFGIGGNKNDTAALDWFRKAAEQGNAKGQYHLGQMYTEGKAGLKESEKEASVWYKKSADQGYAPAQYYLAILYMAGVDGIEKNPEEAVSLLQKAASQGDQEAIQLLSKIQPQAKDTTKP